MPGNHRHIKEFEKKLHKLKSVVLTLKEIDDKFGIIREQVEGFLRGKEEKNVKLQQMLI